MSHPPSSGNVLQDSLLPHALPCRQRSSSDVSWGCSCAVERGLHPCRGPASGLGHMGGPRPQEGPGWPQCPCTWGHDCGTVYTGVCFWGSVTGEVRSDLWTQFDLLGELETGGQSHRWASSNSIKTLDTKDLRECPWLETLLSPVV